MCGLLLPTGSDSKSIAMVQGVVRGIGERELLIKANYACY